MDSLKKFFIKLFSRTPLWLASGIAVILGRLVFWLHEKGNYKNYLHRVVQRCMRVDRKTADRILKKNFSHMALLLFEMARLSRVKKDNLHIQRKLFEISGYEHFIQAREKGQGVILLSAHIGNFEFLISGLPLENIPIHAVVWKQPDRLENRFLDEIREKFGTKLLYSQEINTEDAVRILKSGGIILMIADYFTTGKNVASFFGMPTHMAIGPVHYAFKSKAPIIPVYTVRKGRKHQIIFESPLELPTEGDIYQKGLERIVSIYERWIKSCPEQYFWLFWQVEWGKPEQ